jgi:two-component system chemotaxis sensor kinase CheA
VLDRLMNLMEELVLARNQMVAIAKVSSDGTAMAAAQRLSVVTSDLQEQVMRTRMQPVARVFEKIPRMVRDLCEATAKRVVCEVDDNGTEIDKAIVEAVRDPVMHIVRNAVDHGVETPAQRVARGKSETGRLCVRASHQGGMVVIEVEDDGGGIDPAKMRKAAVGRGVITQAQADRLSEREAVELIFRPGFSTAASVTNISGRGVGMDVVRTHVERAGGQVEIDSAVGRGSTIRLKLPLTLAIFPALLVRSCGQRFAIPQVNLLELVYVDDEQRARFIERVRGVDVFRLRGEVLPLVYLHEVLRRPRGPLAGAFYVVVVAVGARRYGLVVDRIDDTEEIVIKSLHGQLKRLACYAGATVIGDGSVALILDVAGLAQLAGIDVAAAGDGAAEEDREGGEVMQTLVVARVGDNCQVAVPLSLVARLEEVERHRIESVAGEEVIQYRGEIMPVVRPERALPLGRPAAPSDMQRLIVFDFAEKAALAVDAIVDIVDAPVSPDAADIAAPLTLGRVVVFGRTTLLLDPYAIFREHCPRVVHERASRKARVRVMLIDDSAAMRAATSAWLRSHGVDALEFSTGQEALWNLRGTGRGHIDAVVTDLVMPDLDGVAFTRMARSEGVTLPVILWTHIDDPVAHRRAIEAGATACILKSQRERLLDVLRGLAGARLDGAACAA